MSDELKKAAHQWLEKALSDWAAVNILMSAPRPPLEIICFHCQQYIEKLLKGILTYNKVEAPRTHDIRRLIQLAEPFVPKLSDFENDSDRLTIYAVQSRYPDDFIKVEEPEARGIMTLTENIASILLKQLIFAKLNGENE